MNGKNFDNQVFSVRPEQRRRRAPKITFRSLAVSGDANAWLLMSFWVYILHCADQSYYTGHTDNLEKRIAQHMSGEIEGYTSTRLPLRLVFSEQFPDTGRSIG